jgi:hypothetical protein
MLRRGVTMLRLSAFLLFVAPALALAQPTKSELPPAAVFARVAPSVVVVETVLADGKSQGSGVVIAPQLIVTNHHVIAGGVAISVHQGERQWPAKLEAFDPKHDLALLRVSGLDLPRVSMRPSTVVIVGERVYAVGAPHGLELSLSDGLVAALRSTDNGKPPKADAPSRIQTTAPVSPGSSGGGLFDAQGRLIGIITFSSVGGQNLNFAHPTEWITELGGDGAATAPRVATAPALYGVGSRPPRLGCRVDTSAIWGIFSGGAELLESKPARDKWYFDKLTGQTPSFRRDSDRDFGPEELVLADLNRQAGFVSFVPEVKHPTEWAFFFTVDEDSRFRVTFVEPFNFHGQLRVRATSGACETVAPSDPRAIAASLLGADERCERGDIDACLLRAKEAEARDRVHALRLYMRGCEQAHADAAATRQAGARACTEAARLCTVLGFATRAEDYQKRARALSATASPAP